MRDITYQMSYRVLLDTDIEETLYLMSVFPEGAFQPGWWHYVRIPYDGDIITKWSFSKHIIQCGSAAELERMLNTGSFVRIADGPIIGRMVDIVVTPCQDPLSCCV